VSPTDTPTPTKIPTESLFPDPEVVECISGKVLFTSHLPNEIEAWNATSSLLVASDGGLPRIIGLSGSLIPQKSDAFKMTVSRNPDDDYAGWYMRTNCFDVWDDLTKISTTVWLPVIAGKRYKFRIVTTIPSSRTRIGLTFGSLNFAFSTCEVSDTDCVMPERTPGPTAIPDPETLPCGISGVLFTSHLVDEPETWYMTLSPSISVTNGSPRIIGISGSWIGMDNSHMNMKISGLGYSGWELFSDCFNFSQSSSDDNEFYTPYFEQRTGVRYRFRIVTTIPSNYTQIIWGNPPVTLQSCYKGENVCPVPSVSLSPLPTGSISPAESSSHAAVSWTQIASKATTSESTGAPIRFTSKSDSESLESRSSFPLRTARPTRSDSGSGHQSDIRPPLRTPLSNPPVLLPDAEPIDLSGVVELPDQFVNDPPIEFHGTGTIAKKPDANNQGFNDELTLENFIVAEDAKVTCDQDTRLVIGQILSIRGGQLVGGDSK
jgi:hypothetical protein